MLGIDKLHYYDLYVPLVKSVDFKYNIEDGQKLLLDVFKPMGQEYVSTVKKSFDEKWIDYIPSTGKRSGAYSSGAQYDLHPYILMNWTDDYESVSTYTRVGTQCTVISPISINLLLMHNMQHSLLRLLLQLTTTPTITW